VQDTTDIGGDHQTLVSLVTALDALAEPTDRHRELREQIRSQYPDGVREAVAEAIDDLIPGFVYFSQYYTLPGQVSVEEFLTRKGQHKSRAGDDVFEALLELAGTSVTDIRKLGTFEELNAALRGVSNSISEQIFEYWTQNRYLDAVIRLDAARAEDPAPFNAGNVLRTRIDNRRHKVDTSFDERSTGFVWFFSFLVWFSQLKKRLGTRLFVLLDEPGLTLHARAQNDLLRYIKEKLQPEYQVMYSTHSPFMIDPDNLLSARTVEDVEKDGKILGTKVGDNVLSRDPDTISPLQRALDYDITQTLFVGRNTLLVEGASDLLYLKWFSHQLRNAGRTELDYRWAICPVGGVDRIPGFASLFGGNQLNLVALIDYVSGAKQKAERAVKALGENRLLRADTYAGQSEADIEDILGREFYTALVNKTYGLMATHQLPAATGTLGTRILPPVEEHMRTVAIHAPEFDHFAPAKWLFDNADAGAALPGYASALDRMEKLIKDFNTLIA
jgi:hypothetical protein